MERFTGLLGIAALLGAAWFFSTNRKAIRLKTVLWGLGLQLLFALLVLRWNYGREVMATAGETVTKLLQYSFAGAKFVFGELGARKSSMGFFFAFTVLPTIIFISAFFALLYHFGIMQFIIRQAARVMTRLMGVSGV